MAPLFTVIVTKKFAKTKWQIKSSNAFVVCTEVVVWLNVQLELPTDCGPTDRKNLKSHDFVGSLLQETK